MIEHVFRKLEPSDRGFVSDAWVRAAHEAEPFSFWPGFSTACGRFVDYCLDTSRTIVACHPDDPTTLLGFVCYEPRPRSAAVHWLYVRAICRRQGLGRELFNLVLRGSAPVDQPIIATGWSKNSHWIRRRALFVYVPFLALGGSHAA